jgi:putative SbcD/Mre11-related phosphoesterase
LTVETYRLDRHTSLVTPWPALILEDEETLVVADIHLGMEEQKEAEGIHVPRGVYSDISNAILKPLQETGASRVVLLGDVKHEFGRPLYVEWAATKKLIKALEDIKVRIDVVRGNHDNYIIYILKERGIPLHQPYLELGRYTLLHGHLGPESLPIGAKRIVMGHEHPSIALKDDMGFTHRYKAFLHGTVGGVDITVLPSVSPLATGSDVNRIPKSELLSPMLRSIDLDGFTPYLLDVGYSVERFPELKALRNL